MTIANIIAKTGATVAGASLVAMSLVAAVPAAAQTTDYASQIAALQAQIASLQALLSATQGGSTTSASVTFTRDLTLGSTGSDVTALQTWLISKGFSIPAGATGYFGAQTKAAVAAWQAANGVTPAAGYFGAISRAKLAAMGGTTTGGTTTGGTSGTLSGSEGSIDNFKIVGAGSTSLNAADSDTVHGFEFKANGSDLMVNRVDYDVYNSTDTGASRPWNVFKTATLMDGNTTIATIDASNMNNWSEDGTDSTSGNTIYRVRFDGLKDVVKMGNTADFYLSLATANSISNSNTGGTYKVALASQGLRATDAMGLQQYSSSGTPTWNTVTVDNDTTGSLTVSTGSDNPQVSTVQASTNAQTSGVVLTTFTLQAKDADVMVYTIPATAVTTVATTTALVRSFKLYQGSTLVDTESIGNNGAQNFKFDNLNVKIPAGTTMSFSVQADINSIDGTTVPEGSSVAVSILSSGWDAENNSGDNVNITGSVTGNAITFKTIGLSFDTNPTTSATATSLGNTATQQGNFTFTFNVTSFGQDIYFSKNANTTVSGRLLSNGSATSTASSTSLTSTADTSTGNNYVVHSGQTKSVSVTVTVPAGAGGPVNAVLDTFRYGTSDATVSASSTALTTNYQTASVFLHS